MKPIWIVTVIIMVLQFFFGLKEVDWFKTAS